MFIKTTSVSLLLLLFVTLSFSAAEARGFGGMRAGGGSALGGQIRFGGGRGGRRGGYNSTANQGPTVEQQKASYFKERSAQNPYSNVPEHINVSDFVRDYR